MSAESVRASVLRRVQKHGLKVACGACGQIVRHFPRDGRVREGRCSACGAKGWLKTVSWIDEHPARWEAIVKRHGAIRSPFERP